MSKKQWDYIGVFSIGDDPIMANRNKVARWINPFNGEFLDIVVNKK